MGKDVRKKKPPTEWKLVIAGRLRAVKDELGFTDTQIGEFVGASRQQWSNWTSTGPEMPAEEAMVALVERATDLGLTLDWIYRGKLDGLPLRSAIRLTARLKGVDPETATVEVLGAAAG